MTFRVSSFMAEFFMMIHERGLILFFEQNPIFSALLMRKSFLWSIISVQVNDQVVMWN